MGNEPLNATPSTKPKIPVVDHAKNADLFEKTVSSIDWEAIIKKSLKWAYPFVKAICPWLGTAAGVLGKIIVMVEKAATVDPKNKDARLQNAVDGFEQYLVDENIIPEGIEKFFDPIFDWALIKAVNGIISFLNATYGHDWIKVFSESK